MCVDDEIETGLGVHRTRTDEGDKYLVFHCVFILTTATQAEQNEKERNEGREKEDEALCG